MSWREGGLLDFSEVVLRVSVQNHFTDWDQWVVSVWPDLGDIKDVPFVVESVFFWHSLDV